MANLPLGVCGGLALLTIPQLLAARHVPEPTIAGITSLGLLAATCAFLLGSAARRLVQPEGLCGGRHPDRRRQQRGRLPQHRRTLAVLSFAVVGMLLFSGVNSNTVGGWFGSLESDEADAGLGAWMTIANTVGFGLITMVAIPVFRGLPPAIAASILAAPVLIPLLIYAVTPAPGPDQRLAKESFARFFGDIVGVVRRPVVLQLLLLFCAPAASFALTNTLGGLGRDYHASEAFVGIIGGAATTVAGIFGSLIVPPLVRRAPGRPIYLGVGALGALFTLGLILMPHTPALFAVAMIGQNIAQSAALTLVNVLALRSLGEDNPLAATQFGVLSCAANLPITYMQWVDGHAYGAGGLTLMYLADGGLGLAACVTLAVVLGLWARSARRCGRPRACGSIA